MSWGDNGRARPTTKEYADNWDRIFGSKEEEEEEPQDDSEDQIGMEGL